MEAHIPTYIICIVISISLLRSKPHTIGGRKFEIEIFDIEFKSS